MYKILEYQKEYDEKIKKLITEIYIEEFEFEEYREVIKEEDIEQIYLSNGGKFWLAIDEKNNIIGTIAAQILENGSLKIKRFYVKKEFRGMGIAQEMYNILESFAISKGFEDIFLGTFDKLERAIGFYYKNNFIYIETKNGVKYMSKCLVNAHP